jgi:hypothetical protein
VVLARFLTALGCGSPDDPAERAALYRSLLARRTLLVVLDNAVDEAQVEPLLPGTAGCRVLVTSRSRLAGLPGRRLDLAPFADGLGLLGAIVGDGRLAADTRSAREVVGLCEGAALAVRIAGDHLAARPTLSLASFAAELADPRRRLDLLSPGGGGVRAALAPSCLALPPPVRAAFGQLATAPAAALGDPNARDLLDQLADVRLIEVEPGGHYRLPELIRLYAQEL